ncbi:MAG: sulfatase-like hydrolase/transferase [Alphaproteobacteria bacterium]|nr:sulfatase-like hydrolase/transferase [Alphaproteobacteria bacterium]
MISPLTLAALLVACSGSSETPDPAAAPATPAPEGPRPDVVLVTLDTTRADRLGAYGYADAKTDWIDAKANAGMRFERAYSVQPLTIPSHSSMMTGLWPWHHGVRSNGDAVLSEDVVTLAERLQAGGWQTAASVAAFVTTRAWGFNQGFDAYFDDIGPTGKDAWHQERPANEVVDDAIGWLSDGADKDQPVFLWVHLYDAHYPYAPPESYREVAPGRPYDGEIAFVDDQLERLDAAMKAQGRDPIYVLIGDHGESLGEHRELTHGVFVYDSTQHIPLIISGPGVSPAVIDQPVSQVDLVPTLLSLLGRPVPDNVDGKVQPGNPHPVWMESFQLTEQFGYAPHLGVVDGDHKLIHKPKPELYDLKADPGERADLAGDQPGTIKQLEGAFDKLSPEMPSGRTQALDPDALAQLEALGYVTASSFDVDFENLPDPADHREVIGKVLQSEMMSSKGKQEEGLALMKEALDEAPDVAPLYTRYARALGSAGKPKEALAVTQKGLARFPQDIDLKLKAAAMLGRQGQDEQSLQLAKDALTVDPDHARAAEFVTGALINLGRIDEMLSFTNLWLEAHPEDTAIAALRGIVLFDSGKLEEGEKMLRRGASASRPREGVCQRLGGMALAAGHPDDAEKWLAREAAAHGRSLRTAQLQLKILLPARRYEEILDIVEPLLEKHGADPELRHAQSIALFQQGRYDEAADAVQAGLAQSPEHPDLLLMLANIQLKQGDEAAAQATKARADAANQARVQAMEAFRAKAKAKAKAPGAP